MYMILLLYKKLCKAAKITLNQLEYKVMIY